MLNFWRSLYITTWFYRILGIIMLLFIFGYFSNTLMIFGIISIGVWSLIVIIDILQLFGNKKIDLIEATRKTPERFSNGDENPISIYIKNNHPFSISAKLIDELPPQFQIRNFKIKFALKTTEEKTVKYQLRPVTRGEYLFGYINIMVQSPLKQISRRYKLGDKTMVKVYPSFLQMRKFELMAISDRLSEVGIKKIRKIGHQMEFDQIRDYTKGDDYRTINWKATARKNHLMVNQYQDEKSQQVYSLIDMGRTMKMPFDGMTLLDYAINTSLVIANISMLKYDKAGLITFNHKVKTQIPAQRHESHLQTILECLYNQETDFAEHNLNDVYATLRRNVHHRSLIMLYTNFESLSSAKRQIPILQQIAKDHLVVAVFFENTEIKSIVEQNSTSTEDIYIKTIAEKFIFDKKLIVNELKRYGIHTVLTEPGKLTVNALNKYLELKARGYI